MTTPEQEQPEPRPEESPLASPMQSPTSSGMLDEYCIEPHDLACHADGSEENEAQEPTVSLSETKDPDAIPAGLPQTKSLFLQVGRLTIWPFLELLTVSMVGIVDTWLSGNLKNDDHVQSATAAITIAAYSLWLIGMLQGAVGVGATALISRLIGEGDKDKANQAVGQALLAALIWGIFLSLAMVATARPLAIFSGLDGQAVDFFQYYFWIVAIGATPRSLMYVSNACLRGAGDMMRPFWVMLTVNIINILVSATLVMGPEPIGGQGVMGIAVGTACAWFVGGSMVLFMLFKGSKQIRLIFHNIKMRWVMMKRLLKITAPTLIESIGHWSGNYIVLVIIGDLFTNMEIGVHGVAVRIESFSFLPGFAIGVAAATLTGQYLGAGQPDRARKALWVSWVYGVTAMGLCGFIFWFFPEELIALMTKDPAQREAGPPLLKLAALIQIYFATYMVFSKGIQGAGDTRTTMMITYASTFGVRVPAVIICGYVLELGLTGVWLALTMELVVRGMLFMGRTIQGGWMKVKV